MFRKLVMNGDHGSAWSVNVLDISKAIVNMSSHIGSKCNEFGALKRNVWFRKRL